MAIVTGNPIGLLLTLTYTVSGGVTYTPTWIANERRYYMNFARKQSTTDYPIVFWMADSSDHVTGKTGLSPTVTISKNGGAFGAASGTVSEIANGWYSFAGNATDRDTLGSLAINAAAAGADDADLLCQIVSYDPFADIASILTDTGTDGVVVASIATDAITAAAIKADAVTEIQSGLATPTNITAGTITTVTNLTNLPTIPANWLTAAGIATDAVTELQSGLATSADLATVDTNVDSILEDTSTTLPATLTTIEGKIDTVDNLIDTEVAAILEDTSTTLPAALTAIQADLDNPAQYKADVSALATAAALATVDGIVDSILVDTDVTIPGLIAAMNNLSAAQVNAEVVDVLRTDLIPDSYSADGDQPTIAQAILAIHQFLYDRAVSGTTMTVYKPDGTTAAITLTLDDATSPTSYTRSA